MGGEILGPDRAAWIRLIEFLVPRRGNRRTRVYLAFNTIWEYFHAEARERMRLRMRKEEKGRRKTADEIPEDYDAIADELEAKDARACRQPAMEGPPKHLVATKTQMWGMLLKPDQQRR